MSKELIDFSEFLKIEKKLEIKYGRIVIAEEVPKSNKLIKLSVSFNDGEMKTSVTNLGEHFNKNHFIGLTIPFVTNLKPSKIMGITSEVMILPSKDDNGALFLNAAFQGYSLL